MFLLVLLFQLPSSSLSLSTPLLSSPLLNKGPITKRGGGKRTTTTSPFLSSPSLAAPLAFKRRALLEPLFPLGLRLMRVTREEEEEEGDLTQIVGAGEKETRGRRRRLGFPLLFLPLPAAHLIGRSCRRRRRFLPRSLVGKGRESL